MKSHLIQSHSILFDHLLYNRILFNHILTGGIFYLFSVVCNYSSTNCRRNSDHCDFVVHARRGCFFIYQRYAVSWTMFAWTVFCIIWYVFCTVKAMFATVWAVFCTVWALFATVLAVLCTIWTLRVISLQGCGEQVLCGRKCFPAFEITHHSWVLLYSIRFNGVASHMRLLQSCWTFKQPETDWMILSDGFNDVKLLSELSAYCYC